MLPLVPLVIGRGAITVGAAAKARARSVYHRLGFAVETIAVVLCGLTVSPAAADLDEPPPFDLPAIDAAWRQDQIDVQPGAPFTVDEQVIRQEITETEKAGAGGRVYLVATAECCLSWVSQLADAGVAAAQRRS